MVLSILLCKRKQPILAFLPGFTSFQGGRISALPVGRVSAAYPDSAGQLSAYALPATPTHGYRRSLCSVPFLYNTRF